MTWLECMCLPAPDHVRVMLLGTATENTMGLLREGVTAARCVAADRPIVLDLRGLAHLCPGSLWELGRVIAVLEQKGVRVTIDGPDPRADWRPEPYSALTRLLEAEAALPEPQGIGDLCTQAMVMESEGAPTSARAPEAAEPVAA